MSCFVLASRYASRTSTAIAVHAMAQTCFARAEQWAVGRSGCDSLTHLLYTSDAAYARKLDANEADPAT